jgi:hypothetical protein
VQELMSVVGGVIGGAIVSWVFHFAAGRELKRQAGELRRLDHLVLRAIERGGLAEFGRRLDGTMSGIKEPISGTSHGTSHDTGTLTTATRRKKALGQAQPEPGNST